MIRSLSHIGRCLALAVIPLLHPVASLAAEPGKKDLHTWDHITYPSVLLSDGKTRLDFLVGFGEKDGGLGLRIGSSGDASGRPPEVLSPRNISTRIVREDGAIEAPLRNSGDTPIGVSKSGSTSFSMRVQFPWDANTLQAAWTEFSTPSERYSLEVPYGFSRDPSLALPPSIPEGPPKVPEPLQNPRTNDSIVFWENVHYDFGEIHNSWRLALVQSNRFNPVSDVVLYRDDSMVGKSKYLWDLHSPRTTLRIVEEEGNIVPSRCVSLRLHEDGMRRSDLFAIAPRGSSRRTWGHVEVAVDDRIYRLILPSSMYRQRHGRSGLP